MNNPQEIRSLFSTNEFVGTVLRFTTVLETNVDFLLTQYFIRDDRIEAGMSLLLSDFAFSRKVELLASLPIRNGLKSRNSAVTGLRHFRRIRNIVAHNWTISQSEVSRLLQVEGLNKMLLEYPDEMWKSFRKTRDSLNRLINTKDFANPHVPKDVYLGYFFHK